MTNNQDPEMLEYTEGGAGDESAYIRTVVDEIPFDPEQFELPADFEYEGDEDD